MSSLQRRPTAASATPATTNQALLSQEDRELAEALRVQAMGEAERSLWLENVWGRVQRNANALASHAPHHQPTARSYASPEEKNRFDEAESWN